MKSTPGALGKSAFEGRRKDLSFPELADVATSASAHYPTFSGPSLSRLVADLYFINHCARTDRFADGETMWHSTLVTRGLLFRQKGALAWVLSGGHVWGTAVLSIQIVSVLRRGEEPDLWQPAPVELANIAWEVILDVDDVEVQPYKVLSPSHVALLTGRPSTLGICCTSEGEAVSLKVHAAMNAFYTLPVTALTRLASHWNIETAGDLWDVLLTLLQSILTEHSEEDIAIIMTKRLPPPESEEDAMMQCEEMLDELGNDLRKDIDQHTGGEHEKRRNFKAYQRRTHAHFQAIMDKNLTSFTPWL